MSKTLECTRCGYKYLDNEDGRHSCVDVLLERIEVLKNDLKKQVDLFMAAISKL